MTIAATHRCLHLVAAGIQRVDVDIWFLELAERVVWLVPLHGVATADKTPLLRFDSCRSRRVTTDRDAHPGDEPGFATSLQEKLCIAGETSPEDSALQLTKALFACVLLTLLLASAQQSFAASGTSTAASAPQRTAPVASVSSIGTMLVEGSVVNETTAKPTTLAIGQTVSGVVGVQKQGRILAFDVQIGNYQNTSDGTLAVKLCEGDVCSDGAAPLAGSSDNQYLEIPLRHPIEVTAGRTLRYTLTRTAGTNPLAVWTYPDAAAATMMPDGASQPRVLKIGLRYKIGGVLKLAIELACGVLLFVWLALKKVSFRTWVIAGMLLAAGLILAMIVVSGKKTSVHPDEFSHVAAYQYYVHHLLPPAVDSPATISSTSVWGFSYLFELDVVYDIAARVTGQLRQWALSDVLACRLFQFGLWSILCILAMCRRHWAAVLCVVLLTPQVWYVFSYFNADSFPLFLALIAAGLVSDRRNGLHEFLRTGNMRYPALWVAVLCVGLMLVSKSNYLPLIPAFVLWLATLHLNLRARFVSLILAGLLVIGTAHMLKGVLGGVTVFASWYLPLTIVGCLLVAAPALYLGWQWWKDAVTRRIMLRLAGFVLACVVVALPRIAWDVHVNGWPTQKAARIHAVEEARASYVHKPSTIAQGKGYATMSLASHGVSLEHVAFAPYNWASTSLASAFGVYGYMDKYAPRLIYIALYGLCGIFVLLAFYSARVEHSSHWNALAATVVGSSILILASSLLFSWTFTLEPQGRYLFPILPLLALLVGQGVHGRRRRAFSLLVGAAFILSACSFGFVALPAFA